MNEIITRNEVFNDGKTIHLYFNGLVGLYAAYGVSAFLLSRMTEVSAAYSVDMQMPVVVLNSTHYELIKQQLEVVKEVSNYRCLKVKEPYDENAHSDWASQLRQ